eukprot:1386970-Karenia_brevis.AAC.1
MCFAGREALTSSSKASRNVSLDCRVLARLPSGTTRNGERRGERFPVITASSLGAKGTEHVAGSN